MINLIVGFVIGFFVATFGLTNVAAYLDTKVEEAKQIVQK